jgi:transcriptional regulator with XRE-family HTH domain
MEIKNLGKRIKLARVENDLTQTQLAKKIHAKQKSISRYETGASLPSLETLVKIANVLQKPSEYFLDSWNLMTKEHILQEIHRLANELGRPPGSETFIKQSGISDMTGRDIGFAGVKS